MAKPSVRLDDTLPEAELIRLGRVLGRYLSGRQDTATSTRVAGRRAGQGLDYLDFREYQPGDDFRSIDWRASARGAAIQVRRYSGELAADWFLCVDSSASMACGEGGKWVMARQLTAAFAYILLYLGHRVALVQFSEGVDAWCPPGRGHGQFARLLATLKRHPARVGGGGSSLGSCVGLPGSRNPVLVVSDFLAADGMISALADLLEQRELHLLQVGVAEDLLLPADDTLSLEDIESAAGTVIANRALAQSRARVRFDRLRAELEGWSHRHRVRYTACDAGDDWRDVLLRHFLRV